MTFFGMAYAVPLNYIFINVVKWPSPWAQAVGICVIFTVISFLMKYYVRRIFNWLDEKYPAEKGIFFGVRCAIDEVEEKIRLW